MQVNLHHENINTETGNVLTLENLMAGLNYFFINLIMYWEALMFYWCFYLQYYIYNNLVKETHKYFTWRCEHFELYWFCDVQWVLLVIQLAFLGWPCLASLALRRKLTVSLKLGSVSKKSYNTYCIGKQFFKIGSTAKGAVPPKKTCGGQYNCHMWW